MNAEYNFVAELDRLEIVLARIQKKVQMANTGLMYRVVLFHMNP